MKLIFLNIIVFSHLAFGQVDSAGIDYNTFGLNDLISSALRSNVKLDPIEYEKKILSAKIGQVNKQSSPMLQFMLDYLPVNFMNAGEYDVFYSQPLKLFGKLDAQEKLAKTKSLKPDIDRKELENELIKSVKENYFLLSINERLLSFNYEFRQILNTITSSLEIRYSSGKGNQYEILKSNNEFQNLLLEEIELSGNKKIFLNNLRTLSNLDLSDSFRTKNLEILVNMPSPEFDSVKLGNEMIANNPGFKFFDQMKTENELEASVAKLEKKPDLNLMTGYRYMSETGESFLAFSVTVDLPFVPWNEKRIDAEIKERMINEKKINSEAKSLEENLKNELKNIIIKINSSQEKIRYISSILIPQTEQTFKSSLISYETASIQFMDLLDTYRSLRENNKMLAEEETNYLISVSELEKLIGRQILTIN